MLVAGGTGVSFTLPLALELLKEGKVRRVGFALIFRRRENTEWISPELDALLDQDTSSTSSLSQGSIEGEKEKGKTQTGVSTQQISDNDSATPVV
ncbi:hypothetical protein L873DRAFT_343755 [Choiromyces venosus 120613-1]|uniref:Ferric reductase NAD binding domain-containing protein n=1 Tax=Choiromyces venosus 120613-1 TaxID=1336337 RepID=A0A3N4J3M9_9PEZI|nr:hypothetical protein L873DRAFT_343755 [Choiromyces venosus 120613-1]